MPELADARQAEDRQRLAESRAALAQFQRRGEERARQLGLTHVQHHLLLAVQTHPHGPPGVTDLADQLALRPHSIAELVARAVQGGHLHRAQHGHDRRRVQLHLTAQAERHLDALCPPQLADLDDLIQTLTR